MDARSRPPRACGVKSATATTCRVGKASVAPVSLHWCNVTIEFDVEANLHGVEVFDIMGEPEGRTSVGSCDVRERVADIEVEVLNLQRKPIAQGVF
jgi:hypothetical protein